MARNRKPPLHPPHPASPTAGLIDYRTGQGWHSAQLSDVAATLPLSDMLPSRDPVYAGGRNMPGWYFSHTMGRRLPYESVNERTNLIALDLDPEVNCIVVQPFRLWLSANDAHTPDVLVEYGDGTRKLIDVTTRARLEDKPRLRRTFDQTRHTCRRVGWLFAVVTDADFDPQETLNLQWFASFRRSYAFDADIAERILAVCDKPTTIHEILTQVGLPEDDARPVLFHLVAIGDLRTEICEPVTNATVIEPATRRTDDRPHSVTANGTRGQQQMELR